MPDFNPKYRDSVFRSYFKDNTRLLSLCNAILDTKYTDPNKLNINTLEGIFFDKQKNDISCTIDNHFLVLVEHQTTVNDNMPFRCLSYVAELFNKLITDKRKLYRHSLIKFPSPKFFVLFDGNNTEPIKKIMRLSDAFDGDSDSLELTVTAFNINFGSGSPLLEKCRYLYDYSSLVNKVKEGIRIGLSRRDSIRRAVTFCIEHGIMGNYLINHSEEVFNMLTLEWNMEDAKQAWFEDGVEQGEIRRAEKIASKMIRNGISAEEIQAFTDLPLPRIYELINADSMKQHL